MPLRGYLIFVHCVGAELRVGPGWAGRGRFAKDEARVLPLAVERYHKLCLVVLAVILRSVDRVASGDLRGPKDLVPFAIA